MMAPARITSAAFGRTVRVRRGQLRLTLEDVGRRAGISAHHVSNIELGRVAPRLHTVDALAGALGLRVSALLRLVEEAQNIDLPRRQED